MIEHEPWTGPLYEVGIDGVRIAIVGYSHHRDHEDSDGFTKDVVSKVITGAEHFAFFTKIAGYFGSENAVFWNRVLFFNYLPDCVGTKDADRYKYGTQDQVKRAKDRFLRLLQEYRPHKVFVFSKKTWKTMPGTREEEAGSKPASIGPEFSDFEWGTFHPQGQVVMTFGLPHPERADGQLMRRAVERILAMPLVANTAD